MKIGIMSDTHDHQKKVIDAIDVFNLRKVEYVLHAGDFVSPFVVKAFANLQKAKLIAVFGNNEGEKPMVKDNINAIGAEIHNYRYKGQIDGKEIFMTHTQFYLDEVIKSQLYDLIVYGHTHKTDLRRVGKTLVINPGETTDWITGKSSVVILETTNMDYQLISLP